MNDNVTVNETTYEIRPLVATDMGEAMHNIVSAIRFEED